MTLPESVYRRLDEDLAAADAALEAAYPGDDGARQPVHTVYVPADRWTPTLASEWGAEALEALDRYGFAMEPDVEQRVRAKLAAEPIEDLRVDFEDGYGVRGDDEEDAAATRLAGNLRGTPFCGVRIKNLEPALRTRAIRTLGIVVAGGVPGGFVVTLPKVTSAEQVQAFVAVLEAVEAEFGLPLLRFEVQVETPQAVLLVRPILQAGAGRISGLHYGTYDYSAALGIAPAYQSLDHPAADHAKATLQVAAAGTGVRISDGSSNVLPTGSGDEVRAAWALHARLVRRSLEHGFYQGWDLHPRQLVTRFAATYAFYRSGLPDACDRLRSYLSRRSGNVLDEPATAQAMAMLLVRAVQCGAASADEVSERSGVDEATLLALYRRRVR